MYQGLTESQGTIGQPLVIFLSGAGAGLALSDLAISGPDEAPIANGVGQ